MTFLISLFAFVGVLLVLVLAHEWGHYIVARWCGVRVDEFGFGFPPRIKKLWHRAGTDFTLNWIPLGGFVRLKGEDGHQREDSDSFAHKPAWQRFAILCAGVLMNVIVGYVLYVAVFAIGADMPVVAVSPDAIITHERVVVGRVLKDSPADAAGIKSGDVITAVNSAAGNAEILRSSIRADKGKKVVFTVMREKQQLSFEAVPIDLAGGAVGIGVHIFDLAHVRYPLVTALRVAAGETADVAQFIFRALRDIARTLFVEGRVQEGVSGPVGIATVTGQVAQTGIVPLLHLMALLSVNLAVLNVLPIPALDGGRLLFVVVELLMRRRMSLHVQRIANLVGFALLMALVVVVTFRDVVALVK